VIPQGITTGRHYRASLQGISGLGRNACLFDICFFDISLFDICLFDAIAFNDGVP